MISKEITVKQCDCRSHGVWRIVWPSNPTAGHTHRGSQNWKRHMYPSVHHSTVFIIARTWKQLRCPSADKWIRKLWYIYTMEYYSAIKRNEFESVLMRWMKLEPIIQSEVSQKEKHQYSISSVQSLSHVWLFDPMNHSTAGLPVHHQLPEFTQTHVHRVSDAIQPSHPLSSLFPPAPNPSQHQRFFQWVNSSHEVAKVLDFQL